MRTTLLLWLALPLAAAEYSAPAGVRPAIRRPGAAGILPGGRVIAPMGRQYVTGPGLFGLAVSPNGRTIVSANGGPDRFSLTVLEKGKSLPFTVHQLLAPRRRREKEKEPEDRDDDEWHSVCMGLA